MSENNQNDFTEKFNAFADKTMKAFETAGKTAWNRLDVEKQKAEIRNEINDSQRELNSAYEKLGREYYEEQQNGTPVSDQSDLFEIIHSRTKTIELLNEKLKQFR